MSCDLQQLFVKSNTCKIWMNGGESLVKLLHVGFMTPLLNLSKYLSG